MAPGVPKWNTFTLWRIREVCCAQVPNSSGPYGGALTSSVACAARWQAVEYLQSAALTSPMEQQMDTRAEPKVEDRFVGCLLGVAVGDALGMPVEGWSREAIRMRYGVLADLQPSSSRGLGAGQFTDDTQMMLMHAESIVAAGRVDGDDLAQRFVRGCALAMSAASGVPPCNPSFGWSVGFTGPRAARPASSPRVMG